MAQMVLSGSGAGFC